MLKFIRIWIIFSFITENLLAQNQDGNEKKPNIIIILSDDMGFNDVGYHGSDQIPTPNIDALSIFGIALNRYYVAPMCSPSRASLLTGKYPSKIGMQHFVIPSNQPWGLGLDQKILPEYMKDAGYSTHIIGKWHLGFFQERYTPLHRGFDSHFGYLGPYIDYFNHSLYDQSMFPVSGYDMRKNLSINYDSNGIYATDLFTQVAVDTIRQHDQNRPLFMYLAHLTPHAANENDPLQVPNDEWEKFAYITDENRRKYAAMVSRLDAGIGKVVSALNDSGMLSNTIILFFCDNGAPTIGQHSNAGSNYPFRGQKDTPWEGAARSNGAIWSATLKGRQRASNQLIHISDWLPTFAGLAGVNITESIDGHDIWDALNYNTDSPRNEVLLNLDDETPYSSLISGDWKLIKGTTQSGRYDGWLGTVNETEKHPSFQYYGKSILQCPTGKALWPFSINVDNEVEDLLSASSIEQLRESGRINCNNISTSSTSNLSRCSPLENPCLFNITADPCEQQNLASIYPKVVIKMLKRIIEFRKMALPPRNRPADRRSNPAFFNNTWTWWYDELGIIDDDDNDSRQSTTMKVPMNNYSNSSMLNDDAGSIITVGVVGIILLKIFRTYF